MHPSGFVAGAALILLVFWEALETIVYPRRVSRKFRLTRVSYRATSPPWRALARLVPPGEGREILVSVYGPLSLLALLLVWAVLLVMGFALLHWGGGSQLQAPADLRGFAADVCFSGATLFTLTLGDMTPVSKLERLLTMLEAGTGIALPAMVIGYLPSLSQAFSRREVNVTLLDARAGSPPSAGELLIRQTGPGAGEALAQLLEQWDRWAAELLQTHVSFPVLAYYRSQHQNESWVAALTTILDVCALILAGLEPGPVRPARRTFAMACHTAIDLSRGFRLTVPPFDAGRLSGVDLARLRQVLRGADASRGARGR
jgi:Ion channel